MVLLCQAGVHVPAKEYIQIHSRISVLWKHDLALFPFPTIEKYWFRYRFRIQTIFSKFFQKQKKLQRILPFQCPKKLTSQKFGISFYVDSTPDPNPLENGNVMHSRSGSAKLKRYGSCCSGSRSTALSDRWRCKKPVTITIALVMQIVQYGYSTVWLKLFNDNLQVKIKAFWTFAFSNLILWWCEIKTTGIIF